MILPQFIGPLLASVLATFLAQAEPAPPEPAAPVSPPVRPLPGEPPAPDPSRVRPPARAAMPVEAGPAEPAPTSTTPADPGAPTGPPPQPSSPTPEFPSPANTVSILGGLAVRTGSAATALGPTLGFSLGGSFRRRYAILSPMVELGWAADFLFDRFSTSVQGSVPDETGAEQTFLSSRTLTETTFGGLQTLDFRPGPAHFWIGAGGGLAIGFFSSPELALRPGSATAYQPYGRGVVGADVIINDQTSLGVRAGYTVMLTSSSLTTNAGESIGLFGDLLDIHAGLFYRFR